MRSSTLFLAAIFSLFILLGGGCTRSVPTSNLFPTFLHDRPLQLELARTPEEQARGLSGRTELASDRGMLFIFATTSTPSFWMHEMKIPIDLVWIQGKRVVGIERNLPAPMAGQTPVTVSPPLLINRVLELSSGGAERYDLKIGDELPALP